ncbi:hypothetical protein GCK72_013827 [Caenorhabditis remanei]|uniref:Uncharacterized protein n=1 Tax=Caenorhabditis remanei TaxID=31234 RepID=A0A6A5GRR5_CAERE|nr:hypothetical protein GCK72_013827 [Caenorhabditis remanei]KAF1757371.1 hypothetical protein GCK72_013827 [Caenorhabditis remanei]
MATKISFHAPIKSIAFCGSSNIAALFENNVKLASTTTGTHFATFEMDQYSTDVHGCDDFLYVANRKEWVFWTCEPSKCSR